MGWERGKSRKQDQRGDRFEGVKRGWERDGEVRAHFRVLAFKQTTKIQRKDSQEMEERNKIVGGVGKTGRNFGRRAVLERAFWERGV